MQIRRSTHRSPRPVAAGLLVASVLVAAPLAAAGTGDALREGKRNGTTVKETEIIGSQSAKSGKGGYVTRQSNIPSGAKAGGAAVYGCRAPVGGTAPGSAPCLRGSNLAGGNAFEFATTTGVAGMISVGDPSAPNPGRPFVTNATGVASGLNADKVDPTTDPRARARRSRTVAGTPARLRRRRSTTSWALRLQRQSPCRRPIETRQPRAGRARG